MSTSFSFDRIAPIYNSLNYLVFGRSIQKAQQHFISAIPSNTRVLIIGGGSGKILIDVLRVTDINHVTYVEASLAMIRQATRKVEKYQRTNTGLALPEIEFLHGTEQNIPPHQKYQAVITNFVLDLYHGPLLDAMIARIDRLLLPGAMWLVTDFQYSNQPLRRLWQKPLVGLMYRFFRYTAGIAIQPLPNYNAHFEKAGWYENQSHTFWGNFISSKVYRRIIS